MARSLEKSVRHTENELRDTLFRIIWSLKAIKDEMLDLEKKISAAEQRERILLQTSLRKKSNELNNLSDSVIMISRDAWIRFNELTQFCESEKGDLIQLEPIRVLCKNIDVIAADLLCFSLGH